MNWQSVIAGIGGTAITAFGSLIAPPIGGVVAGQVGKMIADQLGVAPTPEAVANAPREAVQEAAKAVAEDQDKMTLLVGLWQAEVARAASNDAVEAEEGFGAWQTRRTVTTYLILSMLAASFFAALGIAMGMLRGDIALVTALVGHAVAIFMAWNGLISGGRAVTDMIKTYKGAGK
jgi:hypothetical protein